MDRLLTAYQESLITLEQLRSRMPELRRQEQAIEAELQSLEKVAGDQSRYLHLVETLTELRTRLRARADTLEVTERQKILRLLVREILVGPESITIRHSIPVPTSGADSTGGCRPTQRTTELQDWPALPFAFRPSTLLGHLCRL